MRILKGFHKQNLKRINWYHNVQYYTETFYAEIFKLRSYFNREIQERDQERNNV